jgi:hypothetical protein
MMLDVPCLVRDLVPRAPSIGEMTVACVHTTRPKYLVFAGHAQRPAYVVQFGRGEDLQRTHRALLRLHARVGHAVPESLVCTSLGDGGYVHIQAGLAGLPWFRVADRCRDRTDWLDLLRRSLAVLARLQAGIAGVPEWTGAVHPGRELRERVAASSEVHAAGLARAARWADALERLGQVPGACRHGDFSVNNLLIGDSEIGIIDFDEFGETMMPLHDEIGLALSLPLSQHGICPLSVRECLRVCLEHAVARGAADPGSLPGLVLHHLLWRIDRCRAWPTRAAVQATLTRYVSELIADPASILGQELPCS